MSGHQERLTAHFWWPCGSCHALINGGCLQEAQQWSPGTSSSLICSGRHEFPMGVRYMAAMNLIQMSLQ